MRAILLVLFLVSLAPGALAEPTVEHHVDDASCGAQGLRVVANVGRAAAVGASTLGHCALVIVTA